METKYYLRLTPDRIARLEQNKQNTPIRNLSNVSLKSIDRFQQVLIARMNAPILQAFSSVDILLAKQVDLTMDVDEADEKLLTILNEYEGIKGGQNRKQFLVNNFFAARNIPLFYRICLCPITYSECPSMTTGQFMIRSIIHKMEEFSEEMKDIPEWDVINRVFRLDKC